MVEVLAALPRLGVTDVVRGGREHLLHIPPCTQLAHGCRDAPRRAIVEQFAIAHARRAQRRLLFRCDARGRDDKRAEVIALPRLVGAEPGARRKHRCIRHRRPAPACQQRFDLAPRWRVRRPAYHNAHTPFATVDSHRDRRLFGALENDLRPVLDRPTLHHHEACRARGGRDRGKRVVYRDDRRCEGVVSFVHSATVSPPHPGRQSGGMLLLPRGLDTLPEPALPRGRKTATLREEPRDRMEGRSTAHAGDIRAYNGADYRLARVVQRHGKRWHRTRHARRRRSRRPGAASPRSREATSRPPGASPWQRPRPRQPPTLRVWLLVPSRRSCRPPGWMLVPCTFSIACHSTAAARVCSPPKGCRLISPAASAKCHWKMPCSSRARCALSRRCSRRRPRSIR